MKKCSLGKPAEIILTEHMLFEYSFLLLPNSIIIGMLNLTLAHCVKCMFFLLLSPSVMANVKPVNVRLSVFTLQCCQSLSHRTNVQNGKVCWGILTFT